LNGHALAVRQSMDQTLLMLARQLALVALREDLGPGDITGKALLSDSKLATADIRFKQDGVLAGIEWAKVVFAELDAGAKVEILARDGDPLLAGTVAARVTGNQQALVAGERTTLNLLQRMCGIATLTARLVAGDGAGHAQNDTGVASV
jgi:nicotinate-nucleotide pyrophosphorylase (carboxylating)